jgi:sugar phosphate isomerase/epimerase
MNIHPCYFCPPAMKKDLVSFHREALQPMVEMAASYGLIMIFENYKAPFDRVSTFKNVLTNVPGLKLHLDFGHTNFGCDNYEVFCGELEEHIRHVHFSDKRSRSDDHIPLGVGSMNWKKAVNLLKATGYDNTITLEIFCNDPNMQHRYLDLSRELIQELWE